MAFGNRKIAESDASLITGLNDAGFNRHVFAYMIDTMCVRKNAGVTVCEGIWRDYGLRTGAGGLHVSVLTACRPGTFKERDGLIYFIQSGLDVHAKDVQGDSVTQYAYFGSARTASTSRAEDDEYSGYRGDLWDVALVLCRYDLEGFRRICPRKAHYTKSYSRSDFERLWAGYEDQCPYWNDILVSGKFGSNWIGI
jgi:hypothetical protein